jgi:release factor glutamine methyltransferase
MYLPSDDTFLLADCIKHYRGNWALEIGVGSGFLLGILEKNFAHVAGSDIDFEALQHSKQKISSKALLVCCDAAEAFSANTELFLFDLVVTNPPYLPSPNKFDNAWIWDKTIHGGPTGIETTVHFIDSALPLLARDGKMLFVVSSLAQNTSISNLEEIVEEKKIQMSIIKEKRLFYETLSIIELTAS